MKIYATFLYTLTLNSFSNVRIGSNTSRRSSTREDRIWIPRDQVLCLVQRTIPCRKTIRNFQITNGDLSSTYHKKQFSFDIYVTFRNESFRSSHNGCIKLYRLVLFCSCSVINFNIKNNGIFYHLKQLDTCTYVTSFRGYSFFKYFFKDMVFVICFHIYRLPRVTTF